MVAPIVTILQFSWRKIPEAAARGGPRRVSLLLRRRSSARHSGAASFIFTATEQNWSSRGVTRGQDCRPDSVGNWD
ncbi:MAG TPA: hypothetical protein VJV96_12000 [Candidatus Angelobacter sp.]|nr:hypothetical protein [Candidatus Angelobacter sp.]